MSAARPLSVIRDARQAAALLQPVRVRLLKSLVEPDSAAGLARRLGMPRQRLGYHLRELEKAGLVEEVEQRRRGNCVERLVRATATTYLISPEVLGALGTDPETVRDRFSSTNLIAVAAATVRDVAALRARADEAGKKLATLCLQSDVRFASASDRKAFAEELTEQVARLVAKYHREDATGGRLFRLNVGSYPVITRNLDEESGNGEP